MIGPRSPKPRVSKAYRKPTQMGRHLICFDPGGTTGWSRMTLRHNCFEEKHTLDDILDGCYWEHGQIDCSSVDPGAKVMRRLVNEFPTAAVVSESFFLRQMAVDLVPVELIAILRHHLWVLGRTLHTQQASQGKRMTDDRLKNLGVYTSQYGWQHARDADRHLIMIIRRCLEPKGIQLQQRLWPQ